MMQDSLFDRGAGERNRDSGMARASGNPDVALWKERVRTWVWELPLSSEFTADDLVEAVGLPTGHEAAGKNNAVGAVLNGMSRQKPRPVIRATGDYVHTRRAAGNARIIAVWKKVV